MKRVPHALAAASHERASAAQKDGKLAEEIVPVAVPQRRGDPIMVDTDEGVRPGTTAESLAFLPDGKHLVIGDGWKAPALWDVGTGKLVRRRRLRTKPPGHLVKHGKAKRRRVRQAEPDFVLSPLRHAREQHARNHISESRGGKRHEHVVDQVSPGPSGRW